MNGPLPSDYDLNKVGNHYGGHIPENPIWFWPNPYGIKRQVKIRIMRFYGIGVHYYVTIEEENNYVWGEKGWFEPWNDFSNPQAKGFIHDGRFSSIGEAKIFVWNHLQDITTDSHEIVEDEWIEHKKWWYIDGD